MFSRILHLLDDTTPGDSFQILASVLAIPGEHHVAVLGNHSTMTLAEHAGLDLRQISFMGSAGWGDPRGWRATRRLGRLLKPTHVHAWGVPAAFAAAMAGVGGVGGVCGRDDEQGCKQVGTFSDVPKASHHRALRWIDRGKFSAMRTDKASWTWVATSRSVQRGLATVLPAMQVVPQGVADLAGGDRELVRRELGLEPGDYPVLVHVGDGANSRQDFAVWTAAILQQLYPRTRLILRPDPRTGVIQALERFRALPDENLIVVAGRNRYFAELLPAADIALVTATDSIPTRQILEAMRSAVPVVATPVACVEEILTHGRTALLARHTGIGIAPPAGKNTIQPRAIAAQVERLVADRNLQEKLGGEARQLVIEQFSPAPPLAFYRAFYDMPARASVPAAVV